MAEADATRTTTTTIASLNVVLRLLLALPLAMPPGVTKSDAASTVMIVATTPTTLALHLASLSVASQASKMLSVLLVSVAWLPTSWATKTRTVIARLVVVPPALARELGAVEAIPRAGAAAAADLVLEETSPAPNANGLKQHKQHSSLVPSKPSAPAERLAHGPARKAGVLQPLHWAPVVSTV